MSASVRILLLAVTLPLPATALAANPRENAAAVIWRTANVELQTDEGVRELRFRRIGIEYWEAVATGVQMGFAIGYSENEAANEGAESARPVMNAGGNFGSIGLRFQAPLSTALSLEGGAEYLLQRDVRDREDIEFETRSWETRADLAAVLRYGVAIAGAGVNWRDIDFRETVETSTSETTRRSNNADSAGAFASLGVRTDENGSIVFRYEAGAEEGWSLRFERRF